jgi:hypothetical protein
MKKMTIICLITLLSLVLTCGFAYAVSGRCDGCHTMHYSQNGATPADAGADGPYPALLLNNCLGCHTGTNAGGAVGTVTPYVYSSSAPTYGTNTLAGGNFYWAVADATTGHNVTGIGTINLNTPPGYDNGRQDAAGQIPGGGSWPSGTLNCAGANGCHGKHNAGYNDMAGVSGAHHANVTDALETADTVANSYRFLIGIHGYEDSDWEYQPTDNAHNQYKGVARAAADLTDKTTISWLCGECHGKFHTKAADVGTTALPWLRHPTDLSLNDVRGDEYQYYNGAADPAAATYSVEAPVASTDVSAVLSTVDVTKGGAADNAIVTCISCHRAHGSPYADILRWDYAGMLAGGGGADGTGCFRCHTTKD